MDVVSLGRSAAHRQDGWNVTAKPAVRDAMLALVPNLRAFALSLTRDVNHADDLVQETILRAWAALDRFEPGSNMKAWLFTILRHCAMKAHSRRSRCVEDPDGSYVERLQTAPDQHLRLDIQDTLKALEKLRPERREALILVAAEGLSCEEVAQISGIPAGTVRSRVARARADLARLLAIEDVEDLGPDRMMQAALQGSIQRLRLGFGGVRPLRQGTHLTHSAVTATKARAAK
jgi:RNA polymerase sigma-70 factor, ECF subfamily